MKKRQLKKEKSYSKLMHLGIEGEKEEFSPQFPHIKYHSH